MMEELYIVGTGGVGKLAQQIVNDINSVGVTWDLRGFFDDDEEKHGTDINGSPVLGSVDDTQSISNGKIIVAIADPSTKIKVVRTIEKKTNLSFATLVHPSAWIGNRVAIGEGSIIYPGCMINVDVKIGPHVQINKGCTVGHDSLIRSGVTFGPSVNIGGNVTIEEKVYFGINSATIQNVSIGANATVGAGATVVDDIRANSTVVGTPAKQI